MRFAFLTATVLLTGLSAAAQSTNYANTSAERTAAMEARTRAAANRAASSSSSSSSSSGSSSNGSKYGISTGPITLPRIKTDGQYAAEAQARQDAAWAEHLREQAAAVKLEAEARADALEKVEMLNTFRTMSQLPALPALDQEAFLETLYYKTKRGRTPKTFAEEVAAFQAFQRDSATADYPALMAHVTNMQYAPAAARQCLQTLYRRFPDNTAIIEKNELLMVLPSFVGAMMPHILYPSRYYPYCHFDLSAPAERNALLDRFEMLSQKYPDLALRAAGRCRVGLNPYQALAERAAPTDLKRALDYYATSLRCVYKDVGGGNTLADARMKQSAQWLVYHDRKRIEALDIEDWQAISKAQGLPLESVAWAFRNSQDEVNYRTRFSKLQRALEREKRVKDRAFAEQMAAQRRK